MIEKLKNVNSFYSSLVFKVTYLVHLFLSILVYTTGNKISLIALLFVSIFIVLDRVIHIKEYLKFKNVMILLAFVGSYIITNLFFLKYGVVNQIEQLVWLVFHFFLLYTNNLSQDKNEIKQEIKIVSYVLIFLANIAALVSLWMLFNNYTTVVTSVDGKMFVTGLTNWGRLFGIYTDPNYSSIFSIVSIFLAYLYFTENKNKTRWYFIVSIIIQILFLVFVQSRSAQVSLIIGILVFAIAKLTFNFTKNNVLKYILAFAISAVIVVVGFPKLIEGYNYLFINNSTPEVTETTNNTDNQDETNVNNQEDQTNTDETVDNTQQASDLQNEETNTDQNANAEDIAAVDENTDTAETESSSDENTISIGRTDSKEVDISNRRFDIWKSGVEIFKTSPVIGVGFRNVDAYSYEKLPNTYIISNDFATFDAFHNTLVDVLAGQGVLGILIVIFLVINSIINVVKNWKYISKEDSNIVCILLAVSMVVASSSMFLSHIFYVNNVTTYCFWVMFGYLMYFIYKGEVD